MTTFPDSKLNSPDAEPTSSSLHASSLMDAIRDLIDEEQFSPAAGQSQLSVNFMEALRELTQADPEAGESTAGHSMPHTLDRFDFVGTIGKGGFSVVLRAHDKLTGRDVAVKVPRLSHLAKVSLLERFCLEPRLLAAVDHPHIVPVYETGWIENIPYFVMALAEKSLRDWLAEQNKPCSFRLAAQILLGLAQGMDHAHRRALLHRDIKTSNVLLFPTDSPATADFPYIARIADFGLASQTDFVESGGAESLVIGTIEYMAPEQAEGKVEEISVQSDIYSLGVILFKLLTGVLPFKAETRSGTAAMVKKGELPSIRSLRKDVPLDLVAITEKCLRRSPAERYASAQQLADDLERFLNAEPVRARPVSLPTRLARWCRRKPILALLAGGLLVSSTVAVAGITWQWQIAENAYLRERAARAKALDTIEHFSRVVVEDGLLKEARFQPLRRRLLADAGTYYRDLIAEERRSSSDASSLADALFQLGVINDETGSSTEAAKALTESAEIRRSLIEQEQANGHDQIDLARTLRRLGRLQRSGVDLSKALATFDEAANLLKSRSEQNDPPSVLATLAAIELDIATLHKESGDLSKAAKAFEQATIIGEQLLALELDDPEPANELARAHGAFSSHLLTVGKIDEARSSIKRAVELGEEIVRKHSDRPEYAVELVSSYLRAGEIDRDTGNPIQAMAYFGKACRVGERVVDENPNLTGAKYILAQARHIYGSDLLAAGMLPLSLSQLQQAIAIREQLVEEQPEFLDHQGDLAATCHSLAELWMERNDTDQAVTLFERAISLRKRLVELNPRRDQWTNGLARSYTARARIHRARGELTEALHLINDSISLHTELAKRNPTANLYRAHLGTEWFERGLIQLAEGKESEAFDSFREAEKWQAPLVKENPRIAQYAEHLKKTQIKLDSFPAHFKAR